MPRTARPKNDLDRTLATMALYRRLLNVQASIAKVKEDQLFKGIHKLANDSMRNIIAAMEKALPKDLVEMAKAKSGED